MNDRMNHWSDEDLLARLYGMDAAPNLSPAHFEECPDCAARWSRLSGARAGVLAASSSASCSDERLRAQRLAVWNRIEQPAHSRILRALPAAAACLVVVLAVALNGPAPQPAHPQIASTAVSDEQLFAEIATVVNADAPRAVEPIRGLFNESSNLEVQ